MSIYELEERVFFDGAIAADIAEVEDTSSQDDTASPDDQAGIEQSELQSGEEYSHDNDQADTPEATDHDTIYETSTTDLSNEDDLFINDLEAAISNIDDLQLDDSLDDLPNILLVPKDNDLYEQLSASINDNTVLVEYSADNSIENIITNIKLELNDSKIDNIGIVDSEQLSVDIHELSDSLNDIQTIDGNINIINFEPGDDLNSSDSSLTEYLDTDLSQFSSLEDTQTTDLYFIDSGIEDTELIVDEIISDHPDAIIIELNQNDGLDAISEIVDQYTDIDSIHIVSQGNYAQIILGDDVITKDNINDYQDSFSSWSDNLSEDADVLFYGCDIAKESQGQSVLNSIAEWTGADIAASTDITGGTSGNWDLEFNIGSIGSSLIAIDNYEHHLETYEVTSSNDTGEVGTLRWAISEANSTHGVVDNIIIEDSIETISLINSLSISDSVTIDGGDGVTLNAAIPGCRIFYISNAGNVSLENMTLSGANLHDAKLDGGAIYIANTNVTLDHILVENNNAYTAGGGIYVTDSTLTVNNSSIINNTAHEHGGGIYSNKSTVYIINSTISNNEATKTAGGGFYLNNSSKLYLMNSTATGNYSANLGAGMYVDSSSYAYLANSLVTYNHYRTTLYGYQVSDIHVSNIASSTHVTCHSSISLSASHITGESSYDSTSVTSLFQHSTKGINDITVPFIDIEAHTAAIAAGSVADSKGTLIGIKNSEYYYYGNNVWNKLDQPSTTLASDDPDIKIYATDQRGYFRKDIFAPFYNNTLTNISSIGAYEVNHQLLQYETTLNTTSNWNDTNNWLVCNPDNVAQALESERIVDFELPSIYNSSGITINNHTIISESITINQLTIAAGATLTTSNNSTVTIESSSEESLSVYGTLNIDSSTIEMSNSGNVKYYDDSLLRYTNSSQYPTFAGDELIGAEVYNLEIDTANQVVLTGGTATVKNDLLLTSGWFNIEQNSTLNVQNVSGNGTLAINANGAVIVDGTYDIGGTTAFFYDPNSINNDGLLQFNGSLISLGTFIQNNCGTVIYNGSNQTVAAANYYNLTISGSGTTTLADSSNTSIANNGIIEDSSSVRITASITASDKIYDGTNSADITITTDNIFSSYSCTVTGNGSFNSKNVSEANTVSSTNLTLSGTDEDKFVLSSAEAQTSATIAAKELTLNATAADKVYDGNIDATVADYGLTGLIGSETVNASSSAIFNSKDVLTADTVTISGIALSDGDNGGLASNYYVADSTTAEANITAKELTLNATAADKIYDGTTDATVTGYGLTGLVGSETVNTSSTSSTFNSKDVLTADTVTISGIALSDGVNGGLASNYYVAESTTAQANITAKELTLNATVADKVYDGNTDADVTGYGLEGFIDNETVNAYSADAQFNSKDVLTAETVSITGIALNDGDNGGLASNYYVADSTTAQANITAASLTITANDVYKLEGKTLIGESDYTNFTTGGLVSDESIGSVTVTYGTGASADAIPDTYTDSVVLSTATGGTFNTNNYSITYEAGDLIVVSGENYAFYKTASGNDLVWSEASSWLRYDYTSKDWVAADITPDNANSYSIEIDNDITVDQNITVDNVSISADATLTVANGYTLTIANDTTISDDIDADGDITVESGGTLLLEDSAVINSKGIFSSNSGSYLTFADGSLIEIEHSNASIGTVTGTGTIEYDGVDQTIAATDYYNLDITGSGITVLADSSNTSISGSGMIGDNSQVEITASITAEDKIYDGNTDATISIVTDNIFTNYDDTVSGNGSFNSANVAEANLVTVTNLTLSGNDADKFILSSAEASDNASIIARNITVTADAQTKVYGDNDPTFTYTSSESLIAGNEFSGILSRADADNQNVGTYEILIGSLSAGSNYHINYVADDFTVTKADLTVTADNQTKVYGDSDPDLTYSVDQSQLKYSDTSSVVSGIVLDSVTGADATAGTHNISTTGGIADNYNIITENGTLTVEKADLTVTADNQTKVYGDSDPDLTYYVNQTQLKYSDTSSVVSGIVLDSVTRADATAGTHNISATGGIADNYNIITENGTLTVEKADLIISASNVTKLQGTTISGGTGYTKFTYAGNAYGESVNSVTAIYGRGASFESSVGVYSNQIALSDAIGSFSYANYNVTYNPGNIIVAENHTPNINNGMNMNDAMGLSTDSSWRNILDQPDEAEDLLGSPAISITIADNDSYSTGDNTLSFNSIGLNLSEVEEGVNDIGSNDSVNDIGSNDSVNDIEMNSSYSAFSSENIVAINDVQSELDIALNFEADSLDIVNFEAVEALNSKHPVFKTDLDLILEKI